MRCGHGYAMTTRVNASAWGGRRTHGNGQPPAVRKRAVQTCAALYPQSKPLPRRTQTSLARPHLQPPWRPRQLMGFTRDVNGILMIQRHAEKSKLQDKEDIPLLEEASDVRHGQFAAT